MWNSFFEESFGAYKDIDLKNEDGYYMAFAILIV